MKTWRIKFPDGVYFTGIALNLYGISRETCEEAFDARKFIGQDMAEAVRYDLKRLGYSCEVEEVP